VASTGGDVDGGDVHGGDVDGLAAGRRRLAGGEAAAGGRAR
jgi:hypothetical protein